MDQQVVIADAGPLIALAKVDALVILQQLFTKVMIPQTVLAECLAKPGSDSRAIKQAVDDGILQVSQEKMLKPMNLALSHSLDEGEKAVIMLALMSQNPLLILDDLLARKQAEKLELPFIGTVRLLHIAEQKAIIDNAAQMIKAISRHGYRISIEILKQLR